jgi:UDP-glucuronate 4-epimerase
MKALVTGAAGFIGSHLSEALLVKGHSVTGADSFDPYYSREIKEKNLRKSLGEPAFHFVEVDLAEPAAASALISQGWDCVIHLAGRGGVRRSIEEPAAYVRNNYMATFNILESMKDSGVDKLVFASTSSVYGNRRNGPFNESDSTDWPVSPYSATKKGCEVLCHTYHHLYGINSYVLRFFTVFGPRQRPDMAIHKFVDAIVRREPIERFGDGTTVRDYTYVDDIVAGVIRAAERVEGYEIINIGGAQKTTLNRLISILEEQLGEAAVIVEKPIPAGDVMQTFADTGKAKRLLDFSAKVSIEDGLKAFIQWYREEQIP